MISSPTERRAQTAGLDAKRRDWFGSTRHLESSKRYSHAVAGISGNGRDSKQPGATVHMAKVHGTLHQASSASLGRAGRLPVVFHEHETYCVSRLSRLGRRLLPIARPSGPRFHSVASMRRGIKEQMLRVEIVQAPNQMHECGVVWCRCWRRRDVSTATVPVAPFSVIGLLPPQPSKITPGKTHLGRDLHAGLAIVGTSLARLGRLPWPLACADAAWG